MRGNAFLYSKPPIPEDSRMGFQDSQGFQGNQSISWNKTPLPDWQRTRAYFFSKIVDARVLGGITGTKYLLLPNMYKALKITKHASYKM